MRYLDDPLPPIELEKIVDDPFYLAAREKTLDAKLLRQHYRHKQKTCDDVAERVKCIFEAQQRKRVSGFN